MKTSTDRILTTHVGSLPRSQEVVDLLFAQDRGEPVDEGVFNETMRRAATDLVKRQAEVGIDIVSDGETSKISYATYIRHRLTGFEGDSARPTPQDLDEFPEYRDRLVKAGHSATYKRPVCKGPIKVKNLEPVKQDIAHMKEALSKANVAEGFLNSVSPGTIAVFQPNEYYPSHETYLAALADAMREEYEMIVKSGLCCSLIAPTSPWAAIRVSRILPTKNFFAMPSFKSKRSTTRLPTFRPTASGCTSAGATTKALTFTIWIA